MTTHRSDTVSEVIDLRVQVYGDPTVTFGQIAQVWSGILGHEVKATDVPLLLIGMKLVRTVQAPDYSDNSDDVEGYLDIFRQLVPDMIHARSVTEYIEIKQALQEQGRHELDQSDPEAWRCAGCDWGKTRAHSDPQDWAIAVAQHAAFHRGETS